MKRKKRWLRVLRYGLLATVVFTLFVWRFAVYRMEVEDKRHAAFCSCCTSIKGLLAAYGKGLEQALQSGDFEVLDSLYANEYATIENGRWKFGAPSDLGGVTQAELEVFDEHCADRDTAIQDIRSYLSDIKQLDYVKFKIDLIESIDPGAAATLSIKCVIDGVDRQDALFQDRLFFRWSIRNDATSSGEDQWVLLSNELIEGVRVAGSGKGFERLDTASIGVDYTHQRDPKLNKNDPKVKLKFAVIEHAAGGISAADYDQDGRTDLLMLDGVRSKLFRNVTEPGSDRFAFEDATESSGLGTIDQACSAMFADFDNDGDRDLFVSRYFAPCLFFRNENSGHFVDATQEMGLDLVAPCVSCCLIDFDRDSYLDIYVGVNGDAFHQSPDIPFYATNGQPNRLLRNVGGQRLVDVSSKSGTESTGWTLAVTSGDYDNDGLPDLAVANDFGRKVLYRNNGDNTFTDQAKAADVLDFSGGMGVAFADLNGDDYPDLFTSNIESGQRYFGEEITLWQFMRNEVRSGWIWHDLATYRELYGLLGNKWRDLGKQVGEGNSVFCNLGNGRFEEWKDCHANRAGWAWSVNPLDFDNDGDMDIYVANGWVSGKKKDDL